MKATLLIVSVLIAGSFAEVPPFECSGNAFTCFFKEIGHHAGYHAKKVGEGLKEVGTSVVNAALEQGKDLLASGAQAAIGSVLEHLNEEGLLGKREVAFFDKVRQHVTSGVEMMKEAKKSIHAAFEKAVDQLTGMIGDMTGLKKIEADADKKIDAAVDEFNKEGKKGFAAMSKAIVSKLQAIFMEGMEQIKAKYGKKMEARAILGFDSLADAWETAKGHLSNAGDAISSAFKPHVESLQKTISDLADQAKEHGTNLVNAATDSFNDLTDKLNTHVDALKGHAETLGNHATNALDAVKEAIGSIAQQTFDNVSDTINDALKTGTDAAGTVVDHVSGSLDTSSS